MTSQELYQKAYKQHYRYSNYNEAFVLYLQVIHDFPDSSERRYAEQQLENIVKQIDTNSVILDDGLDTVWMDYVLRKDSQKKIEQKNLEADKHRVEKIQRARVDIQAERDRVKQLVKEEADRNVPIYDLNGCRGRTIKVYRDRCVITTNVTLGSVLTNNATDGQKTIFYSDVIGVQYKESGLAIGYLQLETASGQMNNLKSNMFGENTFTFDENLAGISEARDYIIYQVSRHKQTNLNFEDNTESINEGQK